MIAPSRRLMKPSTKRAAFALTFQHKEQLCAGTGLHDDV